jgi:zinc transporter ZupT
MAGTIGATFSYILTANNVSCLNANYPHHHNHTHGSFALPFTIGGFLYISLVGIVPEMVEEQDKKVSLIQLFSFFFGILFIYFLVEIENLLPSYFAQ